MLGFNTGCVFMNRNVIIGIVVGAVVLLVGFVMSSKRGTSPSPISTRRQGSSDEILPAVRDTLQKESGYVSCRKALQQLNTYIDRNPSKKPEPIQDPEGLRKQLGLSSDEFAEVNSPTFTLLDAHYIDQCMMLRDAASSLGVEGRPPLDRAQAAFAWVVRQIQLYEPARPLPLAPTSFVLRRGWGSSLERSLAFLAVVQQMGIPGCMVGYQIRDPDPRLVPWIPGALVDKEVYLFDTRMGIPLPAPDGKGIATLRQVRASNNPFAALTLDGKQSYDVSAGPIQNAEILLTVPLSALASRMKFLDASLGGRQKLHSFVDWSALLTEFQGATEGQKIPIHFWGDNGDRTAPIRILRGFMPPLEGGIDQDPLGQMLRMRLQLIPGFTVPPVILQQAGVEDFGNRLIMVFLAPFTEFFIDERGRSPREMVLRGRLDEASIHLTREPVVLRLRESLFTMLAPLTDQEAQWVRNETRQLSLEALQELGQSRSQSSAEKVRRWCDKAFEAYKRFQNAPGAVAAGQMPEKEMQDIRKEAFQIFEEGEQELNRLFIDAVAKPLAAEATFQIALCFHERATRASDGSAAKNSWKSAANRWNRYITDYSWAPRLPLARLLRAEALQRAGDKAAAVAELKEPASGLTNLEETARLFRIRQLQKSDAGK
jgi:hypothetical protein